jgi:hypothetical protein
MRRAALRALLGAGALLALWAPAAASGFSLPLPPGTPADVRTLVDSQIETGTSSSRPLTSHQFFLDGSHNYKVAVFAEGNSVLVEVGRRHDHSLTGYAVKGKVTHDLIRANFGALGSISMRFHPKRGRGAVKRHDFCHGIPRTIDRHGTYSGHVRFKGEDGYFSVAARRADGRLETEKEDPCFDLDFLFRGNGASASGHHRSKKKVKRPRLLFANWRQGGDSALFAALTHRTETHYVALSEQSLGRMGVFHFASVTAPPRVFALDDAITSAKLSGRKPFSGEGTYKAAPDGSTTWEGSLSVDFPGTPDFPLTGSPFEVEVDAGF